MLASITSLHTFKLFAAAVLRSDVEPDGLGISFGILGSSPLQDATSFPEYVSALLRPKQNKSVSRCSCCSVHTAQQITQELEYTCPQLGSGRLPWASLSAWRRAGVAVMQPPTASC